MKRKKADPIRLEHRTFGFGAVLHRKMTDYGDGMLIKFPDRTRLVLLETDGWVNPADARDAFDAAPREPRPKQTPKPIRVRAADAFETVEVGEE